jgi:hypothetical protein
MRGVLERRAIDAVELGNIAAVQVERELDLGLVGVAVDDGRADALFGGHVGLCRVVCILGFVLCVCPLVQWCELRCEWLQSQRVKDSLRHSMFFSRPTSATFWIHVSNEQRRGTLAAALNSKSLPGTFHIETSIRLEQSNAKERKEI